MSLGELAGPVLKNRQSGGSRWRQASIDQGLEASVPRGVVRLSNGLWSGDHLPGARDAIVIPGGTARVGTSRPVYKNEGEGPQRLVRLRPFLMDAEAVTNRRFAVFVAATGYVTEAERSGWALVFHGMADSLCWRPVEGARWSEPEGPGTNLEGREHDPVTQVTWNDAIAFAGWSGGRLPSEAEWEHAARGGLSDPVFPWGDREPDEDRFMPCNIWQGGFPSGDNGPGFYRRMAPARSFTPNGYGLFNMAGNSWEWTADRWRVRSAGSCGPAGREGLAANGERVLKGGSFLCHPSYSYRYRIAARHAQTCATATNHIGFRLVYDMPTA